MRTVQYLRAAAAIAAAVSLAGAAVAADPCPTCANGVSATLPPKPKCDNQIYPLSEHHYYKRYCGPVISPNATYGHFTTQWRPWDGGTAHAACAAPAVAAPAGAGSLPAPAAPKPAGPETPGTLPNVTPPVTPVVPPAGAGKETIPAPAPKPAEKKGLLRRIGALPPSTLLSPGVSLVSAGN
jgi:hypothetical protein